MQRRAAAVYGAFFLVLALGSYGMIAAASAPTITVENPDHRVPNGSQFQTAGTTYDVEAAEGSATITWTDPEATFEATWSENDTVTFQGTNYTVTIPDAANPTDVNLTEARPVPPDVETTEINGTEYAVLGPENGTRELVPLDQFLTRVHGPAETRTLTQGQTYDYRGNRTNVSAVENDSATLTWTAPAQQQEQLAEGDEIDLGGRTFVAHFPEPSTLVLDTDLDAYERDVEVIETHQERINGLWGVSILSGLTVVALFGLAYLPSRY